MKIEEMIKANRADCSGCAACANICPKNAIELTRDAEGFAYPKINPELCIKCGRCDATCPALNYTKTFPDAFPEAFVAIHNDAKILRHSSAGGAFTALSEIILREGGIIFGAAFDKKWRVYHTSARTLDELESLRGSKYVQSQIGDVYRQVKDALQSQKVLFSGTPCQCAGLKSFLGGDHENLLTVDIICHGVPSPAIWEYYINSNWDGHEVVHVNFRSKRSGWKARTEINFNDRGYYTSDNGSYPYGKLFLFGLSERPSCHACKFKFPNGKSDLTLGDAWGVSKYAPEFFDNRGVNVVFIHTAKGKDFFGQTNMKTQAVSFYRAADSNKQIAISLVADKRRENFFAEFAKAADKLAVMEKYFYQDDAEIRKEASAQNRSNFRANYNAVAAHIRKQFKRNVLVVTSPLDDAAQKSLDDYLAQNFTDCGIYLLKFKEEGKLTYTETFSSLTVELKEEFAALTNFVKQFNITDIYTDEPLQFASSVVTDWLKIFCGLSVQTLPHQSD